VHFAYDDDQEEFRRAIRSFLEQRASLTELPHRVEELDGGFDARLWEALATQLGIQGLVVPEAYGGGGYGPIELGLALEETGRALVPGPLFASIALGATALVLSDDERAQERYLPGLAAGTTLATVAMNDPRRRPATVARQVGKDRYLLDGEKTCVLSGDQADVIVVSAQTPEGPGLLTVDAGADGLERTRLPTLDPTRTQARLRFTETPAQLLGDPGRGPEIVGALAYNAAAALAAEQVGGAQGCLEIATDYAKERHQFGRAIGSFQAVKHHCADMLVQIESARTAAWYAAWACAAAREELPSAVPIAQASASEAYTFAARQCIQILGGIGFTWEHPAHLHYKRAISSEQMFGAPVSQWNRLAEVMFDAPVNRGAVQV
jgi:alkylation response protein AidB-like acyl-CoA dehydrogenase